MRKICKRSSDGTYWNGSAFSGTTENYLTVSNLTISVNSGNWYYTFGRAPAGSYVIDAKSIDQLPLEGRDVFTALVLLPSATADTSTARGLGLSFGGQRPSASTKAITPFAGETFTTSHMPVCVSVRWTPPITLHQSPICGSQVSPAVP